jgi:hypothetical protein
LAKVLCAVHVDARPSRAASDVAQALWRISCVCGAKRAVLDRYGVARSCVVEFLVHHSCYSDKQLIKERRMSPIAREREDVRAQLRRGGGQMGCYRRCMTLIRGGEAGASLPNSLRIMWEPVH